MLIKPGLIVYLWLFPIFLFFVIPALCMSLILLREKLLNAKTNTAMERTESIFAQVSRWSAGLANFGEKKKAARR